MTTTSSSAPTRTPARAPLRPIRSDDDHRAALAELSAYFDDELEPGTPDGDRFEVLLTLVESYEAKHFPIDLPDPVEAIKFRMEQSGLIQCCSLKAVRAEPVEAWVASNESTKCSTANARSRYR